MCHRESRRTHSLKSLALCLAQWCLADYPIICHRLNYAAAILLSRFRAFNLRSCKPRNQHIAKAIKRYYPAVHIRNKPSFNDLRWSSRTGVALIKNSFDKES